MPCFPPAITLGFLSTVFGGFVLTYLVGAGSIFFVPWAGVLAVNGYLPFGPGLGLTTFFGSFVFGSFLSVVGSFGYLSPAFTEGLDLSVVVTGLSGLPPTGCFSVTSGALGSFLMTAGLG